MRLVREVRCCLARGGMGLVTNTWAGTGVGSDSGRYVAIRAGLRGPIDPRTGYLCDIRRVDAAVREAALPALIGDGECQSLDTASARLPAAFASVARRFDAPLVLESLELAWTPFTRIRLTDKEPTLVQLTQTYEFAAAHRLHCEDLTAEENLRLFGKCSNPHGHGHNYILEVTLRGEAGRQGRSIPIPELDRIVQDSVLVPLDHRNLNVECAEFRELNPTVENIARVVWQRLGQALGAGQLAKVRVWETGKTYAECDGSEP